MTCICTICHSVCEFISTILFQKSDWLTIRNGCGILIYSAWQWLMFIILLPSGMKPLEIIPLWMWQTGVEEYLVIIQGWFFLFLRKKVCCGRSLEVLLISTHNICFYREVEEIIPELSPKKLLNSSSKTKWEYYVLCQPNSTPLVRRILSPYPKKKFHLLWQFWFSSSIIIRLWPWPRDVTKLALLINGLMWYSILMNLFSVSVHRFNNFLHQPRWLSWICRPTRDQEVVGSTPAEVGNILSRRLIVKYFLRSFSPFLWFKKSSCQFLAKECAQYWLIAWRTKPAQ